jgi:hypothetical protein
MSDRVIQNRFIPWVGCFNVIQGSAPLYASGIRCVLVILRSFLDH